MTRVREVDATEPFLLGPAPGCAMARAAYKRRFDLVVTVSALVLLAPLWLVLAASTALAVWLQYGRPVLYRQRRLGLEGRPFELLKFRTMPVDAEASTGSVWAAPIDRRSTRLGRALRALRLDELPQVVHVLRGEMSLVGPRPERPEIAEQLALTLPGMARRLDVPPGLAGLAQARRGSRVTPRQKLRYDLLYIRSMGPWLDVKLCAASLLMAFRETRWLRSAPRKDRPAAISALSRTDGTVDA